MTAEAQDNGRWALCAAPLLEPVAGNAEMRASGRAPVRITADSARITGSPPVYEFSGDVMLSRADQTFEGEHLQYDTGAGEIQTQGEIQLRESGWLIAGARARYLLDPERGRFDGVREYRIAAAHMQGSAEQIIREGPTFTRYKGVTLSTCLPGNEFWTLSASRASIDTESRQGRAHHAILSVGRLPVFYTPYLQFPVGNERLTGFLAPTIGQSKRNGTTVALPWYWNIAPNYDATVTPTSYWKRGLMMDSEFRYLEEAFAGEISGSYLPHDDRFGQDRWAINQDHKLHVGNSLRGRLVQQRTSDTEFSDDFGDEFDYRSAAFLESYAELSWARNGWLASLDAQSWQRVDVEPDAPSAPYARRPRVQVGYSPFQRFGPLELDIASEWTDFYSRERDREQGVEYHFSPKIGLPLRGPAYFFEPSIAWQYTGYELENPQATDATPRVSVPIYEADARIFLERPKTAFSGVYQTLEPRIFYRNVPDRGQDSLPDFSTTSAPTNLSRLFRTTAFDIERTEQVTVGVTTRYIDSDTGREFLSASAGQTFYLHEDASRDRSDYITALRMSLPGGYSADIDYNWNPENSGDRQLRTLLRWRGDDDEAINLGLRRRKQDGEVTLYDGEISFALSLRPGLRIFAGMTEDLQNDRNRNEFVGLEQGGCCHAWRIVMADELQRNADDGTSVDREYMLELELRGLGGIGDRIRPFLRDEIDGYDPGR
ncbi:LPS-assembly protein LptD [Spiribacter onubensis]